jgi:phosphoglycerate dehydrogenase-like enzyme
MSDDSDSEDETIAKARAADAIITAGARITRRVLENLPNLQVVVLYGVGYDTIMWMRPRTITFRSSIYRITVLTKSLTTRLPFSFPARVSCRS